MSQTEAWTSTQVQLSEVVDKDEVFSLDANKRTLEILNDVQWGIVLAFIKPIKSATAWITGGDIRKQDTNRWAGIVKAKSEIHARMFQAQAANDSHIHEKRTGTNG